MSKLTRSLFCLSLAFSVHEPAITDELPTVLLTQSVNQDGRFEAFSVNSAGMLFHRWQSAPHSSWNGWVPNVFGKISDLDTVTASDGRVFAVMLDANVLVVRSQESPNSGWNSQSLRTGHDMKRIEAAINQDGRVEVFALGGDGSLYSIAQATINSRLVESDWVTRSLEGHDFRDIAASRDGNGCLIAFALGGDGRVYFRKQEAPNGAFGPWSGLDGHDIKRISAARQAAGSVTVFALGNDNVLYSRTQVRPNETWRSWVTVMDGPISDWSATDSDTGLLEVAALWSPGVRFRVQTSDGRYFRSNARVEVPQTGAMIPASSGKLLDPFIEKEGPVRKLSLQRSPDNSVRLVVLNDAGEVYSIERPADPKSSGTWAGKQWQWLGTPAFNGNEPDIVAQMDTCIERLFSPEKSSEINRIIYEDLPARIAAGGSGTPFAQLAKNVSIASVCEPRPPSSFRQTLGIWLGHQATPEVLKSLTVVIPDHSFAYRINANALRKAFDTVWAAQPKKLSFSGQDLTLVSKELEFIDNPAPANDQIKLTVRGTARQLGQEIPLKAIATATFGIGDVLPTSNIEPKGPVCGLQVSLEGDSTIGKAAEILLRTAGSLIDFSISNAQGTVLRITQPVCSIKNAILTSQLLPHTGDVTPENPLQTLGIDYASITVDGNGLTAYSVGPPQPRTRDPAVDWQVDPNSIRLFQSASGHIISFAVYPLTYDMSPWLSSTQWTYDYPLADASKPVTAQVTDQAGNNLPGPTFTQSRIVMTFSVPKSVPLNSLQLGNLTLRVQDADGQVATVTKKVQ